MITESVNKTELDDPLDEVHFHRVKILLKDKTGQSYNEFKKTLKPHYSIVLRDIALGWFSLVILFLISGIIFSYYPGLYLNLVVMLATSILAGLIVAYLVNFFHEAAHYNLAPDKRTNESYANLFIGVLIGQSISYYRLVHWEHHKSLGTITDTERSYFESPGFKFMLTSVTGIRALKLILLRNDYVTKDGDKFTDDIKSSARRQLIFSIIFHLAILGLMAALSLWWLMLSWVLAIGCWYPLFGSLRQVLEHRHDHADKKMNYSTEPHGKFTRIFGNRIFDRIFGSAGFNKHLLHHLEPQISYTRLKDLENFLSESIIGNHIRKKRSSYRKTLINLFNR